MRVVAAAVFLLLSVACALAEACKPGGQFIEGTHDEHHDIDYSEECLSNLPPELVDMFSMESYSDYEEETETEEEDET
jgi:hypothetical protein